MGRVMRVIRAIVIDHKSAARYHNVLRQKSRVFEINISFSFLFKPFSIPFPHLSKTEW